MASYDILHAPTVFLKDIVAMLKYFLIYINLANKEGKQ